MLMIKTVLMSNHIRIKYLRKIKNKKTLDLTMCLINFRRCLMRKKTKNLSKKHEALLINIMEA